MRRKRDNFEFSHADIVMAMTRTFSLSLKGIVAGLSEAVLILTCLK